MELGTKEMYTPYQSWLLRHEEDMVSHQLALEVYNETQTELQKMSIYNDNFWAWMVSFPPFLKIQKLKIRIIG